jgi:Metallo-peptidase family M12B Reprolysin-like
MLFAMLISVSTNAQVLFNYLGGGLNTNQTAKMTKVVTNSTNTNSVIVSVNDIFTTTLNDSLTLNLKNPNLNYSISPISIKATSINNYVWYGEFNNDDNGFMMLIKEGDDVYGQVSINGNYYSIEALGSGKSVISKKTAFNPLNTCGTQNTISPPTTSGTGTLNSVCANSSVTKILFLYTSGANAAVANVTQRANECINQFNTILNNSKVYPNQASVVAATPNPILYNNNITSASQNELDNLSQNSSVQNLRDQYNADIVVLLFKLAGNTGGTYGIANINSYANNAYFLVDLDAGVFPEQLTFSHELGHLYGGRHEYTCLAGTLQCQNDNTNDQYHAFLGQYRKNFLKPYIIVKTAMYSGADNTSADRIMYFSNPDLKYVKKNFALGTAERENVSKKIRDRGYEVAAFRPDGYLVANINGTDIFDPGYTYNWNAEVNCGIQPYAYEWRTSTNGGTYSIPVSTNSTLSLVMPNVPALYLWLRVTSADGQVVNTYKRVNNRAYLREATLRAVNSALTVNETNPYLKIYPNPAATYTVLTLTLTEQSNVSIQFNNQAGEVHNYNYGLLAKGEYNKRIAVNAFTSGMYTYTLLINGKPFTGKLFITSNF